MINFRIAEPDDLELFFDWANDPEVRKNSYHQEYISFEEHSQWYISKLNSSQSLLLIFFSEIDKVAIGQVRIEKNEANESIIGISICKNYREKGFASKMLTMASNYYFSLSPEVKIIAYIHIQNQASYKSFLRAGFIKEQELLFKGIKSFKLTLDDSNR